MFLRSLGASDSMCLFVLAMFFSCFLGGVAACCWVLQGSQV